MILKNKQRASPLVKIILTVLLGFSLLTIAIAVFAFIKLPSVEELEDVRLQEPMKIYDRNNQLIGLFGEKYRKPIVLSELPAHVPQAFLAAEDARFYRHSGIDSISLLRAFVSLVRTGEKGQGGSTITMQVARSFYLSPEKRFTRKFIEILLALKMERSLSKDKILELYLNKIFFGYRAYGIAAASRVYFGIQPSALTIAQAATLATLPQRPSGNNPISNPYATLQRRNNYVLPRMLELGYITQAQYQQAIDEKINASFHGINLTREAGYLSEQVRLQLEPIIKGDLLNSGFKVYTTLDANLQKQANQALRSGLLAYAFKKGRAQKSIEFLPQPIAHYDPLDLDRILSRKGMYGDLAPGIVLSANKKEGWVYLGNGETARLTIDDVRWARKLLDDDSYTPYPRNVAEAITPGEIVWGKRNENGFLFIQKPPAEGSIVAQNPHTGEILVMAGGYDFTASKFNRATQAKRQMGSAVKPFLYAVALENGYTPATIIQDEPIVFFDRSLEGQWRPDNYGEVFAGPVRMREALVRSKNLVSIRILYELGLDTVLPAIKRFGFDSRESAPRNLSLALGAGHNTPLKQNSLYATLANGGYRVYPWFINRVEDIQGNVVYYQPFQAGCKNCFTVPADEPLELRNHDGEGRSYPLPQASSDYTIERTVPPLTKSPQWQSNSSKSDSKPDSQDANPRTATNSSVPSPTTKESSTRAWSLL